MPRASRRQNILEALAGELENDGSARITTAKLAASVGVSEAALYRHFSSKAAIFEALIEFAEETVFGLVNKILSEETDPQTRCKNIVGVLLAFGERNPGITRILLGDALLGEDERLKARVNRFFQRLETQLKQVLREAELQTNNRPAVAARISANLMLAWVEGRLTQFVRSRFDQPPTSDWQAQWSLLAHAVWPGPA